MRNRQFIMLLFVSIREIRGKKCVHWRHLSKVHLGG